MEKKKRELTFLSYAHDDLEKVQKVYEGLKKRKVSVWFDKKDLGPGKWKPQIEKQIPKCRYFIFCVSEASIKKTEEGTGFIEEELQTAWKIAEAQDEKKFTIVPVRFEECGHGDHRLSTFQQYDLFEDFEKGLDKLAVDIGGISLADPKAKDKRSEDKKSIDKMFGKAAISYFSGEYNKSLNMFEKIINIDPKNHYAWNNKGVALFNSGKYEQAIYAFDKAIELKPVDQNSWYNKGIAHGKLAEYEYEEAISAYDKAIELKPDDHEAWFSKGIALAGSGQYEQAISAFDKAIELKPDFHQAYNNKGDTLLKLGKYDVALKAVNIAIEIKRNNQIYWTTKGEVLEKLGKQKEAEQAFKKADKL